MFRSYDHHHGVLYFLAKITFINNTLNIQSVADKSDFSEEI